MKSDEKTTVRITIPTELRVRMSTLGIHVQAVAAKAFRAEVKAREDRISLQKLREGDPRLNSRDLKLRRARTRRLLGE